MIRRKCKLAIGLISIKQYIKVQIRTFYIRNNTTNLNHIGALVPGPTFTRLDVKLIQLEENIVAGVRIWFWIVLLCRLDSDQTSIVARELK